MWRAEKYLNPEGRRQSPMFRPFAALIVGQGLAERRRDAAQCAGEALVRRQRIVAFQLAQTNTPGRAFVENTDRLGGLGLPDNQIAFPMPEGPPIVGVGRTLRHETFNPGATRDRGNSRLPVRTPVSSQARDQLTLEFASGEDDNRTIDRLMTHAHLRSIRVVFFQTARRLFRGQAPAQGANDVTPQAVPFAVRLEPPGATRHWATPTAICSRSFDCCCSYLLSMGHSSIVFHHRGVALDLETRPADARRAAPVLDLQSTCPESACLRHSPATPPGDRLSMRVSGHAAKNKRFVARDADLSALAA